jgi:hypothetical protein
MAKTDDQMRAHRKVASAAPAAAASGDLNRKINALVFLLEQKGLLVAGEFEDAIMNLKVQLGDQVPANGRPRPGGPSQPPRRSGNGDYIGPERRRQLDSERGEGLDRRDAPRAAVAHIAGEVVSEGDRHALSGVQLILRRSSQSSTPIQFRSTKTDMQGRFVFLNLPLSKESEPDAPYAYHLEVRYRNRTVHTDPDVALLPGQTCHHLIPVALLEE